MQLIDRMTGRTSVKTLDNTHVRMNGLAKKIISVKKYLTKLNWFLFLCQLNELEDVLNVTWYVNEYTQNPL